MAGMINTKTNPLAIVDSNVIIYAMTENSPNRNFYETCLNLIESGFKGKLQYTLAINAVIVIEVFSSLRKILTSNEAETRIQQLLRSRHITFLLISKEQCQSAIQWAKEKNVPVNDAIIAANMVENASLIYTVDEDHFKRLENYGVKICNPIKMQFE
jgi:predicted nucleic acid-binding protein